MLTLKILFGFAAGVLGLGLLHRVSNTTSRRRLMVALTFFGGLFYLLEFVLPPGARVPFLPAPADPPLRLRPVAWKLASRSASSP